MANNFENIYNPPEGYARKDITKDRLARIESEDRKKSRSLLRGALVSAEDMALTNDQPYDQYQVGRSEIYLEVSKALVMAGEHNEALKVIARIEGKGNPAQIGLDVFQVKRRALSFLLQDLGKRGDINKAEGILKQIDEESVLSAISYFIKQGENQPAKETIDRFIENRKNNWPNESIEVVRGLLDAGEIDTALERSIDQGVARRVRSANRVVIAWIERIPGRHLTEY